MQMERQVEEFREKAFGFVRRFCTAAPAALAARIIKVLHGTPIFFCSLPATLSHADVCLRVVRFTKESCHDV